MTYNIGYRKPPAHSRFKKGASGNPKGRPKGAKSVMGILDKTLRERVTLRQGGRRLSVQKREALIKKMVNDAFEDPRARDKLVGYILAAEECAALEKAANEPHKIIVEFVSPDGTTRELE